MGKGGAKDKSFSERLGLLLADAAHILVPTNRTLVHQSYHAGKRQIATVGRSEAGMPQLIRLAKSIFIEVRFVMPAGHDTLPQILIYRPDIGLNHSEIIIAHPPVNSSGQIMPPPSFGDKGLRSHVAFIRIHSGRSVIKTGMLLKNKWMLSVRQVGIINDTTKTHVCIKEENAVKGP